MNEVSLETLYGVLKTYELEQIQQKEIYGKGRIVSTSTALVAEVPQKLEEKIFQFSGLNKDTIIAEYGVTSPNQFDGDFYSLEELEQLEHESMALIVKRFGNFRFRRNPNFNRFQRGGSSTSNSSRGGYKTGMVDRSKIHYFNCNEMRQFATECNKPRQFKNTSYDVSQMKKTGKAYLAEGKSWDDSESEDEEVGNLVMMAISDNPSSSKPQGIKQVNRVVWILDSGCSRQMTGDRALLSNMVEKAGPIVSFEDNSKGLTQGYGSLQAGNVIIGNVSVVQGLQHNLLSISQFCEKGYRVLFDQERCQILHKKNGLLALQGVRKGNLFIADLQYESKDEVNYFYAKAFQMKAGKGTRGYLTLTSK